MNSPSPARRVRIGLSAAQRRQLTHRLICVVGMWLIGAAVVSLAGWLGGSYRIDLTFTLAFIVPISLLLLIRPARLLAERRRNEMLAAAGLICPHCAYSMRGLDQAVTRCPECGHPRERWPGEASAE